MYVLHKPPNVPIKDYEDWFIQRVTGHHEDKWERPVEKVIPLFPKSDQDNK